MSKRVESMQIGVEAVDAAHADGRLAALREVREMVCSYNNGVGVITSLKLTQVTDAIDAMIAKEEGR
jgi:hypothetical protein